MPAVSGLTAVNLSVVIALLVSVARFISGKSFHLLRIDLWFAAYVFVLWISAAVPDRPGAAFGVWFIWFFSFLGYLAARALFASCLSMRTLIWASMVGSVVAWLSLAPTATEWGDYGRPAVDGLNTNFTAYVIVGYLYLFLLYSSREKASRWMVVVQWAIISSLVVLLSILETRGALISAVAMIIYWAFSFKLRPIFVKIVIACVIVLSIFFSFGYLDGLIFLLDGLGGRSTGDLSGRSTIWADAREVFLNNWLIGVGPGQFLFLNERGIGAHNFFLTVALDSGVVGLVVMVAFFFSLGLRLSRGRLGPRQINIAVLFFAYWLPIALSGHWELAAFSWIIIALSVQISGEAIRSAQYPPLTPSSRPRSSEPC